MHRDGDRLVWPGGELHCLYDGQITFGADLFPDPRGVAIPEEVVLPVHAYLLRRPDVAPVLIDTGSGRRFGDKVGQVPAELSRLGLRPQDIGTVIFTHLHGDHCGGLVSDGYPNARLMISQGECDHWKGRHHPAANLLAENSRRLTVIHNGDAVAPGLRTWALPGHTPGHMGFVLDDAIAIIGDVIHRADVQLGDPEIATKFDVDPAQATVTRRAALARIAADDLILCGGHARVPGQEATPNGCAFLRLRSKGSGWKAVPA